MIVKVTRFFKFRQAEIHIEQRASIDKKHTLTSINRATCRTSLEAYSGVFALGVAWQDAHNGGQG